MKQLVGLKEKLAHLDSVVLHGVGRDITKPKKTNKRILDCLSWLDFVFFSFLDKLDTKVFFKNRSVRAKRGRVRSKAERKLVYFFENYGVAYIYEPVLVLEGIKLNPDFFLPEYGVYVEFWGLVSDFSYKRSMRKKKTLYEQNKISVVSIYPRHLACLPRAFPILFEKATGRPITLNWKGGE